MRADRVGFERNATIEVAKGKREAFLEEGGLVGGFEAEADVGGDGHFGGGGEETAVGEIVAGADEAAADGLRHRMVGADECGPTISKPMP